MSQHIILFLAANPLGTTELALGREARAIQEELERSGHRDRFEFVTRWAVQPLDLIRELRKLKPTVVHFSGQGGGGGSQHGARPRRDIVAEIGGGDAADDRGHQDGLCFQGLDGRPQLVTSAALRETFGAAGTSVKLVVLNACYSGIQAEALLVHVDCVVGVGGSLGGDAARAFAIGFYGGLGERQSVAAAYLQGCAAISLERPRDDERPQLWVRDNVDADQVVLAETNSAGHGRPIPAYPDPEVERLSKRLEDARARRDKLRSARIGSDHIDREILELRRQLREGGQLRPGDALGDGRYLLVNVVGRGGFAMVWEAYDSVAQQRVAIKVLHVNLAGDPLRRERFFRGAQAMMRLPHPAVVRVLEPKGEDEGFYYFVMELILGSNLREAVLAKRMEKSTLLAIILQVGEALALSHSTGMIHRDIKPANILLDEHGNAKLTDFDLVGAHDTTGGTRTGALGTVVYAAPECLEKPQGATAQADVYSLGMSAIFCLSGRELSLATFRNPEPTIAELDCSPGVRAVLQRAVAWEPHDRFMNAGAMIAELRSALDAASLDDVLTEQTGRPPTGWADPIPTVSQELRELRSLTSDPPLVGIGSESKAMVSAGNPRRRWSARLGGAGVALCGIAAAVWFALKRGHESACTSDAPERWAAARDRVIAALSAGPRPFAGWDAARVAEAIDGAVDALAAAETAGCRGAPAAGSGGPADCVTRRRAALEAAIAAPGSPPPDDPWSLVRPIQHCDPPDSPATSELRGKLRDASAAQAHEIAEAAHKVGDERLAADASEAEGVAALAIGDAARAAEAFRAMNAAGLQIGSVAVQGRGLLHLIELRRVTGEYDLAVEHGAALDTLLARSGNAARDALAVARAEADVFGDLGDVAAAFLAWDRAEAAANSLRDHDGQLAVAIGRASAMYTLRFDLDGARASARKAVGDGNAATPAVRAMALGVVADLAIAAGDGLGAAQALDQQRAIAPAQTLAPQNRVAPAQVGDVIGQVRAQRIHALLGDVDAALAALAALAVGRSPGPSSDPDHGPGAFAAARIAMARGQILLAGDHASEARDVLDRAVFALRGKLVALPITDRIELQLAVCEARFAAHGGLTGDCQGSRLAALTEKLHRQAPARVRVAELEARGSPADQPRRRAELLQQALEILLDIQAALVKIAELRWQIARLCADGSDCRRIATAAREAFQAAGRTAEVAEIDRWLADPASASPGRRDRTAPQP